MQSDLPFDPVRAISDIDEARERVEAAQLRVENAKHESKVAKLEHQSAINELMTLVREASEASGRRKTTFRVVAGELHG